MEWQAVVGAGAAALSLSLILVPVARHSALRLGVTDKPSSGKLHQAPTPYLGGVAVACAVLCSAIIGGWRGEAMAILGAAVLVSCIGLIDDVRTARPAVRLVVETIAAGIAFTAGARISLIGGVGDLVLTIAWLVVMTNAYNLLDNMDACASSVLGVSAVALLGAAILEGQMLVGSLAATVVGAAAGFLVYNWHPARIFLGDAGSLFLGFLVSAVALKLSFPVGHQASTVAIGLIAAPAIFDTTLVVLSRVLRHQPIYIGGTDHTSHRLARLGLQTRSIAVLLAGVAGGCGVLGVAVGRGWLGPWAVVGPFVLCALGMLVFFLRMDTHFESEARLPEVTKGLHRLSATEGSSV